MFELLNETLFEKHIAEYLAGSKMYNQRTPKDFNIQKLVDSDMLLQFLREQPMWQKLITQSFADEQDALNIVIETINTKINRGESLLSLLKNGFMLQGRRRFGQQAHNHAESRRRILSGKLLTRQPMDNLHQIGSQQHERRLCLRPHFRQGISRH